MASVAMRMLPSVPFLKPMGADRPEVFACCRLSRQRIWNWNQTFQLMPTAISPRREEPIRFDFAARVVAGNAAIPQ